jgi:ornithine cyclodeaminase/alanine dehydrogenase-like protein (mu-crystallin family)
MDRRRNETQSLVVGAHDVVEIARAIGYGELMDRVIVAVRAAFARRDIARDDTRARDGFLMGDPAEGCVEWMPHYRVGETVTIKIVSYVPTNPKRSDLPTILGTVGRWDARTGHLVGLMDGVILTALRTGAASAVASQHLAHAESTTLGIVGAGAQAVTQVHAITRLFPIERVLVFDTDNEVAATLARRTKPLAAVDVQGASTKTIEREADIICTATSVRPGFGPVLTGRDLRSHAHINAIGADLPGKTELSEDTLRRALVVPDLRAQAAVEGECQQLAEEEIGPELSEIVSGAVAIDARDRLTVFDSTGVALEDHVAFSVIAELAAELGLGSWINLEHHPADVRNPYSVVAVNEAVGARA